MVKLLFILILNLFFPTFLVSGFAIEPLTSDEQYREVLDNNGKYVLTWSINDLKREITFEIEAETLGYVGFGISPNGQMDGSDLFIAGVRKNTEGELEIYSDDYHGVGHYPYLDDNERGEHWKLLDASENATHTYIKTQRLLNTCDEQDFPITGESTSRVLWSMGMEDSIAQHAERGTKSVSLIPFPEPEVDLAKLQKWSIHVDMVMPSTDTSYWCTMHKRPNMDKLYHVVGFEAVLNSEAALKHTHHFIVSRCIAPAGQSAEAVFGPFVGKDGAECYTNNGTFPSDYCDQYLFVWAVGGKRTMFPLHVGYPIGTDDENVYYMLEVHYDNPEEIVGLKFDTGLQVFYTDELRENDARLLGIGHDSTPTLIIPPNQNSFVVSGHCASDCTKGLIGDGGLKVFNVLLHSHLSGRKLKVRHFRDGKELPWIAVDNNYDFNFQQNQNLHSEIEILPGDHITYECTYDSMWNDGKVVPGGLSTREEMCITLLWVYGNSTMERCMTTYPPDNLVWDFGATNYTIGEVGAKMIIEITEPKNLSGDFIEVLNNVIDWTPDLVDKIQQNHQYGDHIYLCRNEGDFEDGLYGYTKYPEIDTPYEPKNECSNESSDPNPTTESASSSEYTEATTESASSSKYTEATTESASSSENTEATTESASSSENTEATTQSSSSFVVVSAINTFTLVAIVLSVSLL